MIPDTGKAEAGKQAAQSPPIRHDVPGGRFVTTVDGHAGYVEYERTGKVMTITHTVVPSEIGGRGIAGRLVAAALDHARGEGLKVVPRCSYAASWIDRHPQYGDLLA